MRAVRDGFCQIRMPLFVGLWLIWAAALIAVCAFVWTGEKFLKIILALRGRR